MRRAAFVSWLAGSRFGSVVTLATVGGGYGVLVTSAHVARLHQLRAEVEAFGLRVRAEAIPIGALLVHGFEDNSQFRGQR